MKCGEIIKKLEDWAPKEIAWERDNVGLQVGSSDREINNILLCLDFTEEVIKEAIKKNCNLIISHHPFLFHSLKKIDLYKDKNSKLVELLIKHDLNLYSEHTNLDFTKGGVSFELASVLKLKDIDFLVNLNSNQLKLIVFVPETHLNPVSDSIFEAGGGIIGEYSNCSFRTEGKGTFKGSSSSNPALGKKENFEAVDEVKLEVLVNSWKLNEVIKALKKAHPYEEPAFDIYPLKNSNVNYGIGAVGNLENPLSQSDFLKYVSEMLKTKGLRYTNGKNKKIKKVAVCGGSGIEYIKNAIIRGADAYITADIKYHNFQDAMNEILLVDAGHYETEVHSLNAVKKRLNNFLKDNPEIKVYNFSKSTNPVIFYNN